MERRDEEVERLRREVGRLRELVVEEREDEGGEKGGVVDLERDLDAVEKLATMRRHSTASGAEKGEESSKNGVSSNASAAGGDDGMDEGDDEGDE